MNRFLNAVRSEISSWPQWWSGLSLVRRTLPIPLMIAYFAVLASLDGLRNDHVWSGIIILILCHAGPTSAKLLKLILPVYLTGVVYDSQRYYADHIRGEIHVAWPYEFDKKYFGFDTPSGRLTPNEYLQMFIHPALDVVTGFFYLFFIGIYVAICVYHAFFAARFQKDPLRRARIERMSPYVTWAFFWVNMIGYSTYYWFPAAPPWYVSLYGLGPARLDVPPNPAGCIRFDQVLGTHFFTEMYGRSADVFGAIPSLHVAYPFLSFLFAMRFHSLRAFSFFFYAIMVFSAVYLNHHYVVDILWGTAYAILVYSVIHWYSEKRTRNAGASVSSARL